MPEKDKIDPVEHKKQVIAYAQNEKPIYAAYADTLERIFKKLRDILAPDCIISTREKSIASFAEKAARKRKKYDDPVHQLTDLCGARVIVNTQDQMRAVCAFIRDSHHFIVDEANSDDAGLRLKDDQFGYRSIHFIVQLKKAEIMGVPVPKEIGARKAEIQVRTVLQHAWAAVTHDRLYKSDFTPPPNLRRLANRQAALIEDADEALNVFDDDMQSYLGSYTAYLKPDKLAEEIDIQGVVLNSEPDNDKKPAIALRLAKLFRASGNLDQVIETLRSFKMVEGSMRLPILVELGTAIVEHDEDPGKTAEGVEVLTKLALEAKSTDGQYLSLHERKLLACSCAVLANGSKVKERHMLYTLALRLDPDDPYILCSQLAYNLSHTSQTAIVDSARPAILRAIEKCHAHIAAGIQLPRAWLTVARLHLLLREDSAALDHYAKAIHFYLAKDGPAWTQRALDQETDFLEQIQGDGQDSADVLAWAEQFLKMGYWLKNRSSVGQTLPLFCGRSVQFKHPSKDRPILVVAGGTRSDEEAAMREYASLIDAAMDGFDGVVISGGTKAGVPGLVGEAAAAFKKAGSRRCQVIGYRPEFKGADTERSPHYDEQVPSGKDEALGLGEPLQMWLDILAAEIDPANVRLLGINGGNVSRFEYAIALGLGATVGLVESSGRSADLILLDPDWRKLATLLPLPKDPMTAQAFVQVGHSDTAKNERERMGRVVHETYLKIGETKPNYKKPNTLPWEALPEGYQQSNRDQAAYAFTILRKFGFTIEKKGVVSNPEPMPDDLIEILAEIEHGRWNYERLKAGWRFASQKDDDKSLSPWLIPWEILPDRMRKFDRDAVNAYPRVLAAGGYELKPPGVK